MMKNLIMVAGILVFIMTACSPTDDLRGQPFLYPIPKEHQMTPHTMVLVQPLSTGCHHCIDSIKEHMASLSERYYVIMPKRPYRESELTCYQPPMGAYAEWNKAYARATVFTVDSNGYVVDYVAYDAAALTNLIMQAGRE